MMLNNTKAAEPGKEKDLGYVPVGYPFPGYKVFYRAAIQAVLGFTGFPELNRLPEIPFPRHRGEPYNGYRRWVC